MNADNLQEPTIEELVTQAIDALRDDYGDIDVPDSEEPSTLVNLVGDDTRDSALRSHAGRLLAHLAERYPRELTDSLPSLIELVGDDDRQVRRHATRTVILVFQRTDEPVPLDAFETYLNASDRDVRRQSARALASIAETRPGALLPALSALCGALNDEYAEVQRHAIRAIGYLAEEYPESVASVAEPIRTVLRDDFSQLTQDALWILASIADTHPEAVWPELETLLDALGASDTDVARQAVLALEPLARADPEPVTRAIQSLVDLLAIEGVYKPAARVLVELADAEPERVHASLRETIESARPEVREQAVWGLALLASAHPELVEQDAEWLLEAIQHGDYQRVSTNAARALAALAATDPTGPTTDRLIELSRDEEPTVRRHACVALCEAAKTEPSEEVVSAVIDGLEDPSDLVRSVAVGGLSEVAVKHPNALRSASDAFVGLLDDETESLRGHAWFALGAIGTAKDLDRLREFRDAESSPEVAGAAEEAIEQIEHRSKS